MSFHLLKNFSIQGSRERAITLDVFLEKNGSPKPVVILVHGFKGFKDWGHFNLVAEEFAQNNFVFIKFNFSFNGTTPENPAEFTDLEAFGHNNYIIELDDLKKVIDWIAHYHPLRSDVDVNKMYLLGHSRGGGIAVLKAHEDHRIKKLVTWASVSDFVNRNKKITVDTWKRDGVVYAANARTGQQMPMYVQFYDIMMANKERLNVLRAAKDLKIPYLIIHGDNDEAVNVAEAHNLHKSARQSKLLIPERADHTFGVKHPHSGPLPAQARQVVDATLDFFRD